MALPTDFLRRPFYFRHGLNASARIIARFPAPRQLFQGDAALSSAGLALAGAALLFAVEMHIDPPHERFIPGKEYLHIFSQPNSSALRAAQQSATLASEPERAAHGVDYTPTASIPVKRQPHAAKELPGEPPGYEILGATEEAAWVRRGAEISEIRRGDDVPGLGKILSIKQEAGRWRLILESGDPAAEKAALETSPRRDPEETPVAKPLIFNGRNHHVGHGAISAGSHRPLR